MGQSSYYIYLPVLMLLNSCFLLEEIIFFLVRGFYVSSRNNCLVPLISLILSILFHPGTSCFANNVANSWSFHCMTVDLSDAFIFLLLTWLLRISPHQAYRSLLPFSMSLLCVQWHVRGLSRLWCCVLPCLGGRQTSPLPLVAILVHTSVMWS